jgi:restriction system protein
MTVPDFQFLMLPFLKSIQNGQETTTEDLMDVLSKQLNLSEQDLRETLPSGQSRFTNRVAWTKTYLKKALLIDSTGRGKFKITQRGLEVLAQNPPAIDINYLLRFQEFQEFRRRGRSETKIPSNSDLEEEKHTPEEVLEAGYQTMRRSLSQEILERVKKCSPRFFETLVVDLLVAMGYGGSRKDAGQAVGQSGDGGIDGIIKEDRLGLDVVYIQAKRWEATIGRPVVQTFAGSLDGQRAKKGVLITTSQFSQEARDFVSRIEKKIVLIDGEQLAQYMIDYNIGVTEIAHYIVKRADLDYFEEA